MDSTRAALDLLKQAGIPDGAKILIHDSVRPFVEQQSIDGCIDSLDQFNASTVAYASTDTILLTEDLGERKVVRSVPDRTNAFRAQTPQAFRFHLVKLKSFYQFLSPDRKSIRDCCNRIQGMDCMAS